MARLPGVPTRLSSFVGRKKELAELRRLLAHTRLLTVVGPGGSGKTRLATKFAHRQETNFAGGSIFVELGAVDDGALVVQAIARSADFKLGDVEDKLAALAAHLGTRPSLVLLDNCEHLVAAVAQAVVGLLEGCPNLTVVATSRERLNVEGETAWTIPRLSLPDEGDGRVTADTSDAVQLFVDRARSVRPGFLLDPTNAGAVLTICRRLDGIPLAIELAAARMTTLSPADIVPRLDSSLGLLTGGGRNMVSRQQTLRATIDWSYQLLDLNEQRLLMRLSAFAGHPTAEAIQEVCTFPPLDPPTVLDALTRLVEKSMVQVESGDAPTRYRLLETIREYAAERLEAEQLTEAVRERHMARYRRLAAESETILARRGAAAEYGLLWQEMDDVRAALSWSHRDPEVELEMVGCLGPVWMTYAQTEGRERLGEALRRALPTVTLARGRAAATYSSLVGVMGWGGDMVVNPIEVVQILDELGDPYLLAHEQLGFGYFAERQMGDLEGARVHMLKAIDGFEATGATSYQATAMGSLGSVEMQLGSLDQARRWIDRAVEVTAAVGDRFGSIGAHWHLGSLELTEGNNAGALEAFLTGLEFAEPGDVLSITYQVAGVACALVESDPGYALRLFAATDRLREEIKVPLPGTWGPRVLAATERARAALPAARADDIWARARAQSGEALAAEVRERFAAGGAEHPVGSPGLSRRELEIAELVASGMTSRAIAGKLFLSERTVETHLTHVMTKLGFSSRAQVATWVAERRAGS